MSNQPTTQKNGLATVPPPRLPYLPQIQEKFGIDHSSWKALVEAVFPNASSTNSVILALSYCRARKLDPFKRNVHIVPIYDKLRKCMVDTIWPGIGELRTTAFRTGLYAGRDKVVVGPLITETVGKVSVTYPEWMQVTVYRMCGKERVAFAGPQVYWLETYAQAARDDASPNSMWRKRPWGQLEKCAEAAALRAAFPEEIGNDYTNDEAESLAAAGMAVGGVKHVEAKTTAQALMDPKTADQASQSGQQPTDAEQATEGQQVDWQTILAQDLTTCQTIEDVNDVERCKLEEGYERELLAPFLDARRRELVPLPLKTPQKPAGELPLEPEPSGSKFYKS